MAGNDHRVIDDEQLAELRSQIKDLKPLVDRGDPCLSKWELEFLTKLMATELAGTTYLQYCKVNQIYETKYLRGTYSGKRKFS